jgi:cytochrome d ubiquinol oxidase subunit I
VLVLSAPLGFLALEAGWIVTEVGRQPWVIYGIMRTADAVTPAGGVGVSLAGFSLLYAGLGVTVVLLLRRLAGGELDHGHGQVGQSSAHGAASAPSPAKDSAVSPSQSAADEASDAHR